MDGPTGYTVYRITCSRKVNHAIIRPTVRALALQTLSGADRNCSGEHAIEMATVTQSDWGPLSDDPDLQTASREVLLAAAQKHDCPKCLALPGTFCVNLIERRRNNRVVPTVWPHAERLDAARARPCFT